MAGEGGGIDGGEKGTSVVLSAKKINLKIYILIGKKSFKAVLGKD